MKSSGADQSMIEYRPAQMADIAEIVRIHQAAFPGFFLTSMGASFLKLLYREFATAEGGICIVAHRARGVLGLVAGTTEAETFFGTALRKRGWKFALASLPGLLRHPWFGLRKCLGAVFYRGEKPASLPGAALLSSLAVSPEHSGKGIGQALVEAFCAELRRRGVTAVYLTTDEADNERGNRFYQKCGFQLVDTFERTGNRCMNRWAKHL